MACCSAGPARSRLPKPTPGVPSISSSRKAGPSAPPTCATTWRGWPLGAATSWSPSAASTRPSAPTTSLGVSSAARVPRPRRGAPRRRAPTGGAVPSPSDAARDLRAQGDDVDVAEALMLVARAALLAGDVSRAAAAAGEATARFEAQGRAGWWAAAASLRVEAHHRAGTGRSNPTPPCIDTVIAATEAAGLAAASAYARVVAAELAAARGDVDDRRTPPRCHGARARARRPLSPRPRRSPARWPAPDVRTTPCAVCAATVDEFASLTSVLGGTELRAHVAMHVAAVVDLGVALSVRSGDAELAFAWSERQRASALATAPVRPPEEAALAHDLDRLRAAIIELDVKDRDGVSDPDLALRCAQLQDSVRRRTRQAAGERGPAPSRREPARDVRRRTSPRGSRSSRSRTSSPPCAWSTAGRRSCRLGPLADGEARGRPC